MELRLLSTEEDRKIFADRVQQVRARHGGGFRERPRSRLGEMQLSFGNLYALFKHDGDPAERMVAGLVIHDLEMFPQTCSKPDLSHLPPRSVLEISDLWSCAVGAGTLARAGAAILAGMLNARALLAYLSVKPFDGTPFYRGVGFVNVGEPIEYPYLETLTGQPIWAQPMIMEGEALKKLTWAFSRLIIETCDDNRVLRFSNFLGRRSESGLRVTARDGFFVPTPGSRIEPERRVG
jgi:hypothetical protein